MKSRSVKFSTVGAFKIYFLNKRTEYIEKLGLPPYNFKLDGCVKL